MHSPYHPRAHLYAKASGTSVTLVCHGGENFGREILQMTMSVAYFFRLFMLATMEMHKDGSEFQGMLCYSRK